MNYSKVKFHVCLKLTRTAMTEVFSCFIHFIVQVVITSIFDKLPLLFVLNMFFGGVTSFLNDHNIQIDFTLDVCTKLVMQAWCKFTSYAPSPSGQRTQTERTYKSFRRYPVRLLNVLCTSCAQGGIIASLKWYFPIGVCYLPPQFARVNLTLNHVFRRKWSVALVTFTEGILSGKNLLTFCAVWLGFEICIAQFLSSNNDGFYKDKFFILLDNAYIRKRTCF